MFYEFKCLKIKVSKYEDFLPPVRGLVLFPPVFRHSSMKTLTLDRTRERVCEASLAARSLHLQSRTGALQDKDSLALICVASRDAKRDASFSSRAFSRRGETEQQLLLLSTTISGTLIDFKSMPSSSYE